MMPPTVPVPPPDEDLTVVLRDFSAESGRTLLELVDASPVLLIFLRHFGCSFCRETMDQVSKLKTKLEARGIRPVFVHLGSPDRAQPYFNYYELADVERISNPDGTLYAHPAFHLRRKHLFLHFLIPANWKRMLKSAIRNHGIGMIKEDAHQMPGVFFLRERKIVRSFRYKTIADQPDYMYMIA